jgi:dihydroxyacetone kinase-like predicted kinase
VNPDGSVDEAEEAMNNAVRSVRTMEITYAVRDAVYDGCVIKQGDFLALDRLKPFGTDSDIYSLLRKLAHAAADGSCEYIGIYYGENVTQEQAEKAREIFEEICPEAEINVLDGGQPVYYYMISVE